VTEATEEASPLTELGAMIAECRRCERLVEWRERVARDKRAAFRDQEYWGRPVAGFGDPKARLIIVGLAPAAHGANRTGRMFTGDRSGDWLYRALHIAGFASQGDSIDRNDGLKLADAWVTSAVKCTPPDNKPEPGERKNCEPWLDRELDHLDNAQVFVCLGGFAYVAVMHWMERRGVAVPRPRPRFEHEGTVKIPGGPMILSSYHPSQQNTFTGRLTETMFDRVFARAKAELWTMNSER
jgi:uracil-DNA glycosylase family 4